MNTYLLHTLKWIIASLEQHWHKCRIKTKELKLYLEFVLDVMLSYDEHWLIWRSKLAYTWSVHTNQRNEMDPNDIFHIYTLTEVSVVSFNYTIIQ